MRRIKRVIFVLLVCVLALPIPSHADGREHFLLGRPIPRAGKPSQVDRGLPFGWNRDGKSPTHHGDDFENGLGVPVVAAADGTVYFAGSDSTDVIGQYANFYGNAVIITHDFTAPGGGSFSTLYGHLNTVLVSTGQRVTKGQEIGTVGMTGIALWYHLHFEVRIGNPHDYYAVRNPELWITPQPGRGTLVGRVVDMNGNLAMGIKLIISRTRYTAPGWTYVDPALHSDPVYNENFTIGDLPAGCYKLSVRDNGGGYAFAQKVCIKSGQNTWIDVNLGKMY